jgi:hypothetical protein
MKTALAAAATVVILVATTFAVGFLTGNAAERTLTFNLTSTSTFTTEQTVMSTTTSQPTVTVANTTVTSTVYTYSVPSNDIYVGLLGCSVSTKVCSLIVTSGYFGGNITISQAADCVDLTWFPNPNFQSGSSSSSCTVSPSPVLKAGQWAYVNATISWYYIPRVGGGPPPVGSGVFGTLSIKHGVAQSWEQVAFAGVATP